MTVNAIQLKPGSVVAYNDERWLIQEPDGLSRVLATRISDGRREFLAISDLKRADELQDGSPDEQVSPRRVRTPPPEHELTKADDRSIEIATEKFQVLASILNADRKDRKRMLEIDYCKKFDCSIATAYRHRDIAKKIQKAEGLLRAERTDRGKRRLSAEVLAVIDANLKTHRLISTPKTIPNILDWINGDLRKANLPEISRSSVYARLGEISYKKQLKAQGRKKQVRDQFNPKATHLPDNDYPLAIVQVDHSPVQICFVDEVDRQPIGDAWLTLVIECYSRMVLGFFVTFDPPSTLSTGMALGRAFLPKDNYLADLGVKGSWPCWGIPDVIIVDNAAELNGRMMHSARRRYRFDLRDRPVGAPNFGGHVESAFKTFMYEFKSLPGTKFSNPVERAEYDSEGRAILTLRAFEKLFTDFLVNDFHLKDHSGDGMAGRTPLQRWQQGVLEGDVFPPTGLPDIPADPLALKISLMPIDTRVISKGTVELHALTYYSNDLKLISDNLDPRTEKADRTFEVRYDPRDISCIWVWDPTTTAYVIAYNMDHNLGSISLWEWTARKKRQKGLADVYKDDRYDSKVRRHEIVKSEAKKTKQTRLDAEKARIRSADLLVKPPAATPPKTAPQAAPSTPLDAAKIAEMRSKVKASIKKT